MKNRTILIIAFLDTKGPEAFGYLSRHHLPLFIT